MFFVFAIFSKRSFYRTVHITVLRSWLLVTKENFCSLERTFKSGQLEIQQSRVKQVRDVLKLLNW